MKKKEDIEFRERLRLVKASPLHKTDREILIKIVKLSLKEGYCYMSQKKLAQELYEELGSGSVPTLQRHLYRLQDAKILCADINAGEKGVAGFDAWGFVESPNVTNT